MGNEEKWASLFGVEYKCLKHRKPNSLFFLYLYFWVFKCTYKRLLILQYKNELICVNMEIMQHTQKNFEI